MITSSLERQEKVCLPIRVSTSEQEFMKPETPFTLIGGGLLANISSTCSMSSPASGARDWNLLDVSMEVGCGGSLKVLLEAELTDLEVLGCLRLSSFFLKNSGMYYLHLTPLWRLEIVLAEKLSPAP